MYVYMYITTGDANKAATFESCIPPPFLLDAWKRATGTTSDNDVRDDATQCPPLPTHMSSHIHALHPPSSIYLHTGLRFWARSRVDAGASYEISSQTLIHRAKFLLELASAMEEDIQPMCEAMVDVLIESATTMPPTTTAVGDEG